LCLARKTEFLYEVVRRREKTGYICGCPKKGEKRIYVRLPEVGRKPSYGNPTLSMWISAVN
jgi:hypothetical protein